jgi:hypothetical protein
MTTGKVIGLAGYAGAGKNEVGRILEMLGFTQVAFADRVKEITASMDPIVAFLPRWTWTFKHPVLRSFIPERFYRTYRLSDLIELFGAEEAKREFSEVRRSYQKIGTEVGRELNPNTWVEQLVNRILASDESFVVTDVRFPNEMDAIRALGGEIWRIDRPGTGPVNAHVSESALDGVEFDEIILNDSTIDHLEQQIVEICLDRVFS